MDARSSDRTPEDLLVPRLDEQGGAAIFHSSIPWAALAGGIVGGVVSGVLAGMFAAGGIPIAGLGHWAAAGTAPIAFAGTGVGACSGALSGALVALFRLPSRKSAAKPVQHAPARRPARVPV